MNSLVSSVYIYTTTNCAFCKVLKQWLDSKEVPYEFVDVEKEPFMNDRAFQSFPVTIVTKGEPTGPKSITYREHIVKGFDRKKLQELLDI